MSDLFGDETIPTTLSPELTGHVEEVAGAAESQQPADGENQQPDANNEHNQNDQQDVQPEHEEETDPPGHSDELLAGKYKSVDELVKGYKNLESQFHKSRQQTPQPTQQPQVQPNTQPDDYNDKIYNAFIADPAGTLNYLVEQKLQQALAPINQERQLSTLGKNIEPIANEYAQLHTDEGAEQFFAKVNEIAQELGNPELLRNPSQRVLRMAAAELWGTETKANIYDKAREQGRREAEEMRRNKQGVAVNVSKKPNEAPKTEADIIREGILGAGNSGGIFG